jgi:hypothetical protein
MTDYEVSKTDQGYVVAVGGKYYKIPDSARLMTAGDLKIIFEGLKTTTPIAGTLQRTDMSASFIGEPGVKLMVPAQANATYQWQKAGVDVPGATLNTYTAPDDAAYTVNVKTASGIVSVPAQKA